MVIQMLLPQICLKEFWVSTPRNSKASDSMIVTSVLTLFSISLEKIFIAKEKSPILIWMNQKI